MPPKPKPRARIKTTLVLEVYNPAYGIWDIQELVKLFNSIHLPDGVLHLESSENLPLPEQEDTL